jgi:hypothetical protein
MKKIWILTTLLFCSFCLTWCISFNLSITDTSSAVDEDKPSINTESGRLFTCNEEVGKYFDITTFGGWWDTEVLEWDSYILSWDVTYEIQWETIVKNVKCVIDMNNESVTILEI